MEFQSASALGGRRAWLAGCLLSGRNRCRNHPLLQLQGRTDSFALKNEPWRFCHFWFAGCELYEDLRDAVSDQHLKMLPVAFYR